MALRVLLDLVEVQQDGREKAWRIVCDAPTDSQFF
jgi:hypothetical protein